MWVGGSGGGTIEGVELPPAGTYRFDEAPTGVGFVARHLISKVP